MFCTKCGARNEDGAKFCVQCGNRIEENIKKIKPVREVKQNVPFKVTQSREDNIDSEANTNKKIKVFPIILFVILLVAVIIFPKFILSGNSEKKIAENFIDAEFSGDAEQIMELIPDKVYEKIAEDEGMSREEFGEMLKKVMESAKEKVDEAFGEGWKYSCNVNDISEVKGEKFDSIIDDYEEITDDMGISEAVVVETEISVSGKDIENSVIVDIPLIKIDGKWYLDFASFDLNSIDISSLL